MGGTFFNASNFLSAPLPMSEAGVITWTALPDPPQWVAMAGVDTTPQFHCAVNRDGKVFLFGNAVGFAVYDIASRVWSTPVPTYKSVSSANLLNQQGLNSAVQPDGYTISILATTPPTYMELDTSTMTIEGIAVEGFTENLHGFCMDVVATSPPTPVVCGGSTLAVYSGACWQLGLGSASASVPFANIPAQDGCSLMAYGTKFMVISGYLQTYHTTLPTATTINPDMLSYDLAAQNKTWTTISNSQQANPLPVRCYNSANAMPGTGAAIIFGGYNPGTNVVYDNIYFLDLSSGQWVSNISPASNPFPTPSPSASGAAPSATKSGNSGAPTHPTSPSSSSSSSNTGAIAGGVVGSVAVIGLAFGIFFYQRRKTRYNLTGNNPEVISMDEPLNNKGRSDLNSSPDSANSWGQGSAQPPRNPQFFVASAPSAPQSISGPAPHNPVAAASPQGYI
ncbi:hypothetical protein EMPS_01391 [Entomortierella parvispora]|uniref:Galactose oxidase n=1 Tax=Entomortierella parvispora TaxID=205924 RepID=A0A9P3H2T2_9FUNG|nr:hypothetical protein EMPS_01391 [Entomortierella parvispora]